MRHLTSLATAFVLVVGAAGACRAQGIVPGGWDFGIGYRSIGVVEANSFAGRGYSGYGSGVASSPNGVNTPSLPNTAWLPGYAPPARTVNGLGSLGNVVRRSTRTRRVR